MKELLELIEAVDPKDTDALDEIDARVWCSINSEVFYEGTEYNCGFDNPHGVGNDVKQYTRSREALKAIRPEGWWLCVSYDDLGWVCELDHMEPDNSVGCKLSPPLPTEELAELHAIIQVIEYKRKEL